nr:s-adenosylmethionine carrier 1, chloroplastic/mitochondrial [Quercus suber]
MVGCNKPPRSDQPSIKYRSIPVKGVSPELADFVHEEYAPTLSVNEDQQCNTTSVPKSPEILSTAQLISAVGQIWDCASHPLDFLQPKKNFHYNDKDFEKKEILGNLDMQGHDRVPTSADRNCFHVDVRTAGHISPMVLPNLDCPKATQKMSIIERHGENYTHSLFWSFLQGHKKMSNELWKEKRLSGVKNSYELGNIYGWMGEIIPARLKHPVKVTEIENKKTGESCFSGEMTSLYKDYFLDIQDNQADVGVSRSPSSSIYADYHINSIASCSSAFEKCQNKTDGNELPENNRKQPQKSVVEDEYKAEIHSSAPRKPCSVIAKQEHAFAGALAGIFVSLSLHPVDTVKTVIQSCNAKQKSICYIGKSIVSDRGLTGLYRGIATNITSSAPISALYTFTYESVKGALLPLFPKEYYSIAHCMAGGCASVATSFIFTPSERIKQQMQVSSHYQNCWNAFVGIIGKGGLRSLYAGWGAVLCRNVPHSVIKFYTYESLKGVMMSSMQSSAQLSTLQTLVCGGLAGSTAALFTTPFDVVKTRLQTQIPGSMSQYGSVFHALREIGKNEGLQGLYRGLTPRLDKQNFVCGYCGIEGLRKAMSSAYLREPPEPSVGNVL